MPYPLRLPEELRAQVKAVAIANNRSVNTELVLLVQEGLNNRRGAVVTTNYDSLLASSIDIAALAAALAPQLAQTVATEVVAKLKEK